MHDDDPAPDAPENGGIVYVIDGRHVCPRCTARYASPVAADECCWWDDLD